MAKFMGWIDERFPATKVWEEHVSKYYTPKNFNFWYYFGSLLMLVMVCLLYTSPSPRDKRQSRMPSSA